MAFCSQTLRLLFVAKAEDNIFLREDFSIIFSVHMFLGSFAHIFFQRGCFNHQFHRVECFHAVEVNNVEVNNGIQMRLMRYICKAC